MIGKKVNGTEKPPAESPHFEGRVTRSNPSGRAASILKPERTDSLKRTRGSKSPSFVTPKEPSKAGNNDSVHSGKSTAGTGSFPAFNTPPLRKVTRKKPAKQNAFQKASDEVRIGTNVQVSNCNTTDSSVKPKVEVIEIDLDEESDENDTKDGGCQPQHEEADETNEFNIVTRGRLKEKLSSVSDGCNDSTLISSTIRKQGDSCAKQKQDAPVSRASRQRNSTESREVVQASRKDMDSSSTQKILLALLRQVRRKVDSFGYFSGKVDPDEDGCPGYYDIIDAKKEAMDLDTMEDLIKNGAIHGIDGFECHLKRIVSCAKKYHTDESNPVREEVDKIEALARPLIRRAIQRIERKIKTRTLKSSKIPVGAKGNASDRKRERNSVQDDHTSSIAKRRSPRFTSQSQDSLVVSSDKDESDSTLRYESLSVSSSSSDGNYSSFDTTDHESHRPVRETGLKFADENSPGPSLRSRTSTNALKKDESKKKTINPSRRSPRATPPKKINYSEADSSGWESDKSLEHHDPDIPGSDIPACDRDLSKSVVTQTSSRDKLLSLIPDMLLVCNEAARRAALKADPDAESYDKPLSEVYMRELLEYHDQLSGFLVKMEAAPNYLQGFIVITNFQIWHKTFRWAIGIPATGITPTDHRVHMVDDGTLTAELQNIKQSGDCSHKGIIFHRVAEIALLGGLGCGSVLLSKALSKLCQSGKYDYVVLQSTKMAIRFYERHGFVRVGAVTRFKDNAMMPEVSYRHWSEIVDGEALEPSYMMALRLKETFTPDPCTITSRMTNRDIDFSDGKRVCEVKSALTSVFVLLAEAITIRATGSQIYSNSFREMMMNARIFAKSAEDEDMVKTMDKALALHSNNSSSLSKNILRDELEIPKPKEIRNQYVSSGVVVELFSSSTTKTTEPEDTGHFVSDPASISLLQKQNKRTGAPCASQLKVIKVSAKFSQETCPTTFERAQQLKAEVFPTLLTESKDDNRKRINGWGCRDVLVSIVASSSMIFNESALSAPDQQQPRQLSDNKSNVIHPLVAQLLMPPLQENLNDVDEATKMALENLKESFREDEVLSRGQVVRPGDSIMFKVDGFDGSPLWLSVDVEKHCSRNDRPPGGKPYNSYIITYLEGGIWQHRSCVLDLSNQGVGRNWCTHTDWCSFPVLPAKVLDAILIGSWVEYPADDGNKVQGHISRRVGGGLTSEPKWRLVLGPAPSSTNEYTPTQTSKPAFKDFTAGELREAVSVDDDNWNRTIKVANEINFSSTSRKVPNSGLDLPVNSRPSGDRSSPIEVTDEQSVMSKERTNLKEGNPQKDPAFADLTKLEIDMAADEWATRRMKEIGLEPPFVD